MADDEIDERLSRRFSTSGDEATETEDDTEEATGDESQNVMTSQGSQSAETGTPSQNERTAQNADPEAASADPQDSTSSVDETSTQNVENRQSSQNAQNVKKEWNVRSIYLTDDLNDELSTAFKRLDFELSEAGVDIDFRKTRHFYPLIVELGLEELAEMDAEDVATRLQHTEE
jgi:hypothetical protein